MSKKLTKTTIKKTKIIGEKEFIEAETGLIRTMNVVEIQDRDANFHKLWLGHILQTLDKLGNQKIKVVNYIMGNINKENQFIMTQRKIADEISVSIKTVNETIGTLIEYDFMTNVQTGVYRINPEIIFKGTMKNRLDVLFTYKKEREVSEMQEDSTEIKISGIESQIARLTKELDKLKNKKTGSKEGFSQVSIDLINKAK